MVARPPFEFYVFEPMTRNDLSKVLCKIQQLNFFGEVTALFLSVNWEKWSEKVRRYNIQDYYDHPYADF